VSAIATLPPDVAELVQHLVALPEALRVHILAMTAAAFKAGQAICSRVDRFFTPVGKTTHPIRQDNNRPASLLPSCTRVLVLLTDVPFD
jgi:hypothetical protein